MKGLLPDAELDIREEVCPYTFLRARLALEPMDAGQALRVVLGNETSARDVPRSLADAGHTVARRRAARGGDLGGDGPEESLEERLLQLIRSVGGRPRSLRPMAKAAASPGGRGKRRGHTQK